MASAIPLEPATQATLAAESRPQENSIMPTHTLIDFPKTARYYSCCGECAEPAVGPRTSFTPAARQPILTPPDKKVRSHGNTHADHNAPHLLRVSLLRVMRAEPSPGERTGDHHDTLGPQHCMRHDKRDHRRRVDRDGQ